MKKRIFFFLMLFIPFYANSITPESLEGIWQGDDRIIFFGHENQIAIILKEYYGWYYDRACEPEDFSQIKKRARNAATQKKGYDLTTEFKEISENQNLWEMTVHTGKKENFTVPLFIYGNKIYLNFLIKVPYESDSYTGSLSDTEPDSGSRIFAYWQGLNTADSLKFSGHQVRKDIISWYITEKGTYRLRFWQTDMLHENSKAAFSDENRLYTVNKHIFSAGQNYTCVSGRSTNIRNVEKYSEIPFEYTMTENGSVLLLGKPYLSKVEDKSSAEELLKIVEEANSRRKPDPPALFPPEELDWHWDLINQLEKGNSQIEQLRKRQKEFGPRAQDIERKK